MESKRLNLDAILDEIGYVGRSQIIYFILILFIVFYTGVQGLAYAFTAGDLNYRCRIDQCDLVSGNKSMEYNSEWLTHAVPFDEDSELPEQCYKYKWVGHNLSDHDACDANDFDARYKLKCSDFVFETEEQTILTEFNLTCNENKWKLSLPGTLHNTGSFFNLLIIGYISDRFGRKTIFVISPILAAIIGIIQPFAWNYTVYAVLKFFETFLSGGTYSASVILAIELVSPPHRAMAGTIIFASAALGNVFLGFTAMLIENWKIQTFVSFIPSLVAIAYIWIIPESLKWLLVKKRYQAIADILLRIIKWNGVEVSPEVKEILTARPELMAEDTNEPDNSPQSQNDAERYPIWDVFQSPGMMLRIVNLSFCWLTNIFVFYGLAIISVSIGGNKYSNFMIINIMDIPACLLVIFISHRVGRKKILCSALIMSGIALLTYPFVPDLYWLKLIVFMICIFAITVSFSTLYIFTSELLPTNLRQTLMGLCSAVGRIGSIIAPQAPLLELVMKNLTVFLFGGTALAAGILCLQFPETLNIKLPDTIEEALRIGKKKETFYSSNFVMNKINKVNDAYFVILIGAVAMFTENFNDKKCESGYISQFVLFLTIFGLALSKPY